MFADVDIGSFELGEIVQRRFVEYISWDSLIEDVTSKSDNKAFRDQVVQQIRSCEEFERSNPHLVLPEVANHLIVLISETYPEKEASKFEIN
jgi:hypothetical protein